VIEIGLTGGIGSGKSTVSALLVEKGAVLVDADAIVREVQEPGTPVFQAMVERFGEGIVAPDGTLDRAAVAAIVFADPDELNALNGIVHPAVTDEMTRRREAQADTDATVILDIPLLVESKYSGLAGIIVVDVDPEIAVARLVEHRGFSEEDARARISRQASRDERLAVADFVVDNSGDLTALRAEVDRCWAWILTLPRPEPGAPVEPIRGRAQQS
jgi:dephospho-CoA kinase